MTPKDASILSRRLELHLRRNEFEACHNILNEIEAEIESTPPEGIAELPLDLRWVNALETLNYIKISDLDMFQTDSDWDSLRESIAYIGPAGVAEVRTAIEAAREQIKLAKEIDKAEEEAQMYLQAYDE